MKPWYKNAIIYALDIKVFYDSNNDGIGDFHGLIKKLDYLASMGITCLWLLPFHPSPKADDGYDVADYYNVDPALGDLGDFAQFINEAKKRGLRIIMDLVANHSSIEHPWFKDAKSSRDSPYRDYYIWKDEPKEDKEKIMFEGMQESIWEYSEETDSYYLHRYFKEQADFNIANPELQKEILKIMDFWLKIGVSGFRIDAAHVISDPSDIEHVDYGVLHKFFGAMRNFVDERDPETVLLGEASVSPDELEHYFTGEKEKPRMHMLFNFLSNKHLFLAFAREDGDSFIKGLKLYNDVHLSHWVNFVRHHDELNLELLNEEERYEVWEAFAPEEEMRLFGHGIRRRLAAMVNHDEQKMKLFYAITFSLPGTPLLSYGEEIGMGDDMNLDARESVRTPMQWCVEKNAGFSEAPKEKLYRPVIDNGDYDYKKINIRDQQLDPNSFLNWMCYLIRMRREYPVFGNGDWHIMNPSDNRVAAWYFEGDEVTLMVACNLSKEEVTVNIISDIIPVKMVNVFEDSRYDEKIDIEAFKLKPFGFRWIEITEKEEINYINK